jgi:uncharacterized alpha-E superfamily protein
VGAASGHRRRRQRVRRALLVGGRDTGGQPAEEDVIEFLLHGEGNPSSILGAIASARENLRTARPVVPREAWEACNNLWLACSDNLIEADSRQNRVQWLRRVIAGCQRINGILLGTMSRDEAMSFLVIGQNLERADLTTRVLDVRSESLGPMRGDDPYDVVHWMAVLRSLAAYQPFRRAMPARPQGGSTLRFLLQDDRFPRAVSACLTESRPSSRVWPGPRSPSTPAPTPPSWWRRRRCRASPSTGSASSSTRCRWPWPPSTSRIEETYFRPTFAGWQPESVAS